MGANNAHTLLEFPPVISGDHIFQLGDDGVLRAINKHTGHRYWQRSLGRAVGVDAGGRRQDGLS